VSGYQQKDHRFFQPPSFLFGSIPRPEAPVYSVGRLLLDGCIESPRTNRAIGLGLAGRRKDLYQAVRNNLRLTLLDLREVKAEGV
jgi:hypothetical protein